MRAYPHPERVLEYELCEETLDLDEDAHLQFVISSAYYTTQRREE